ncbi:hypothetical protein ACN6MY_18560 [Peribacillus sp. B-H-3]|uniref:hypothetical protein n=1 Tax=Peribacillus sp. B-H-3 TaxID=3400420 RepID=UPI003B015551
MTRRGAGVVFIAVSAFLISAKYICAAIFCSNVTTWNDTIFENLLMFIGKPLSTLSIGALILGVLYLVWGEYDAIMSKKSKGE